MQKLAEISIRRPVFATMIVMALVVVGAAGYFKLGVDRTPPVDLPSVFVSTRLSGASPAEMESLVAQPIEEVVNTVEGITELRSISGQGNSFIIVQFDLRRNVSVAAEDVRTRVATVVPDLPREADPPVITKFDSDRSPVLTVALSGERSQRELTELADKVVKRQLERALGVGEVEIRGGLERAISIWVDADRLSAYQIPITAVLEAIKAKLPQVAAQLPPDVKFEVIEDQSRYIYEALQEINTHLIIGSILASLVVFGFMRSWRATLIAAVAIPTSVISTFGMMWALNFTLNSVTMLALVLMVGIVIDDAIVVLENIFRWVEEKKMNSFEAARAATKEIGTAVLATTLSLVVIFVPVSFMSSIAGRFLFQFGLTAAVAVMVSLLVSFTLTPMMSARLFSLGALSSGHQGPKSRRGFYSWIDRVYSAILGLALRHRAVVVIGAALVMLSSFPLYRMVRQEFTPANTDEGEFEIGITAPEGTSLTAMDDVLRSVEQQLRALPSVRVMLASIGAGRMGGVNYARVYIRIPPHHERRFTFGRLFSLTPWKAFAGNYTQRDVVQQVRQRLKKFGDIRASVRASASSISIGGPNFEIDFSILGPDLESLAQYAEQLRRIAPGIGVVDADTTLKLDKPESRVELDRARAAALGVSTDDIASALRIMVGGDDRVSRFRDPTVNDDYDVQLRLAEGDHNDPTTISRLYVPRENGGLARLDNLVKIVPGTTASRIDRLDRQRQVSLRGGIAPGYALADRLEALRAAFAEMNLPPVYTTQVSGRGRELERTFKEFLWAFLLSVIFMYMILASQYESLVHPFTILLSLPLSLPFALFSIWLSGNTLNLYSALGLLVLFGVVKKNAILQIDHMNNLRAQGMGRWSAILQGNRDRLRPILMTTLTLVAGMIPLAVGSGPGAEERRAVAVVVIGGQTLCLLLTLVVTP